jgi:hypothetical protein
MLYNDKVLLTTDPNVLSGVNREAFVDQQEWSLYQHVDSEERYVTEFLLQDDEDDDDEHGDGKYSEGRKRPVLTVTCHAGLCLTKEIKFHFFSLLKLVNQIIYIVMVIFLFS